MEDIFPRVLFTVFGIPVRDTVVATWVMMVTVIAGVLLLRRHLPKTLEMVIAFLDGLVSDVIGGGRNASHFIPFLGALVLFIAASNIIGFVPVLKTPTTDINTPLALALIVFFAVHYFGIRLRGPWPYLKAQLSPMIVLDIIGQLSRTMSLTLRLFGNIIAGEIVIAVIFSLVKPIAPLPMMGLGMFTGILQAYIFVILATSYIGAAVRAN